MKKLNLKIFDIITVIALLVSFWMPAQQALALPVTGEVAYPEINSMVIDETLSSVQEFADTVKNGNANQIVGVYAENGFELGVVQQPSGNAGYVSTSSGVVTQFGLASSYGSIGLLAHNYLAGNSFSGLSAGQKIFLVYGDGSLITYKVSEIRKYQALSPNSAYSNFVNLNNPKKTLTSSDLFKQTYGKNGALVFQTCINKDGNSSWGRLFIIAYKA